MSWTSPHSASRDWLTHGSIRRFRKWLVERVAASRWGVVSASDDDVEVMAREIGVQPDVLLEARVQALRERVRAGRVQPMGDKKAHSQHYQFELLMPEEVFRAWKHEAQRRGVDGSALLRSLIHSYLLGTWQPTEVPKRWVWCGRGYTVVPREWKAAHGSRYPFRERCLIPPGAQRALVRRGRELGTTPSAIVRALVLNAIDGLWAGPGTITIVDCTGMYDDEDRYFHPNRG